jgi:hypothetical protein
MAGLVAGVLPATRTPSRSSIVRLMLRGASSFLAGVCVMVLVTTTTHANTSPSAHLVYIRDSSAAACPDEESLRQAVKLRVGYDPFFPWAKTVVVVEVSGDARSFVAHVRLVDENNLSRGVRELRSTKGCPGLIDATALAISIALDLNGSDPTAPASVSVPTSASAAPPASASEPPPAFASAPPPAFTSTSAAPTAEAVPRRVVRIALGLDGVVAIASTPAVTPGVDVWAAARLGIGSLGLELRGDAPGTVDGAGGARARVLFFAATASPCAHAGPVFACALGTLGWLHASGTDVRVSRAGSALVPSVGPRAGVELALGPSLALQVHADLLINLVLPTVSLNDAPAWTLPPFSGVVAAGLAYRFP